MRRSCVWCEQGYHEDCSGWVPYETAEPYRCPCRDTEDNQHPNRLERLP